MRCAGRRLAWPLLGFGLLITLALLPRPAARSGSGGARDDRSRLPSVETAEEPGSPAGAAPRPSSPASAPDGGGRKPPASSPLDRIPLGFTAASPGGPASYAVRDRNVSAFFSAKGVALALMGKTRPSASRREVQGWGVHWGMVDGREVEPRSEGELPGRASFFKGSADRWKVGQKTYSRMVYEGVKPGVDLIVESHPNGLKYSIHADRAADVSALRLRYSGAQELRVVEDGAALEIVAGTGTLREDGLRITQHGRPVRARYVVTGSEEYALALENADPDLPLEVDPVIGWSTFLGGTLSSGSASDYATSVAVDSSGNVYVGGYTYSADFPPTGGYDGSLGGYEDAFVTKFNASGALVWSTYLGGSSYDEIFGLAVDGSQNVYVTGNTSSSDFPTTGGALDISYSNGDGFVARINAAGSSLGWSTFLGGSSSEYPQAIALDTSGNIYVTGYTYSSDFPTTGGAFDSSFNSGGSADGFVSKLNSAGTTLAWSTYLGGSSSDYAYSLAVDGSGNVYATGITYSTDYPTTLGAYDTVQNGSGDVFVTKLSSTGSSLSWSTYIGGTGYEAGYALAIDGSTNVYVTGYSSPSGLVAYPTTVGAYKTLISGTDVFVTKVDAGGSALAYSTFLGGTSSEYGYGIAVDGSGQAVVTGVTYSTSGFPVTAGVYDPVIFGGEAFVTKFNSSGSGLLLSSFLGGSDYDYGQSIALDASSNIYVAGYTYSTNFPVTAGAYKTTLGGSHDAFVTKLNSTATAASWSTYLGGTNAPGDDQGRDIAVDAAGNVYVTGIAYSSNFPTSAGAFDPSYNGGADVFVTKYNPAGTSITWSTYIGGFDYEYVEAIAVDGAQNVYLTGSTYSSDYPTSPLMVLNGGQDGFVTKIDPTGTGLVWSRFLGGSSSEYPHALSVDASGGVLVAGETYSADFPTTPGAFQTVAGITPEGFVSRILPAGTGLSWSTFLGGNSSDYATSVRVDASGFVYVGGTTYSTNFPTSAGAYRTFLTGSADVFVSKLDPSAVPAPAQLVFSTYVGGINYESLEDLAIDGSGNVYFTGNTNSGNYPTTAGAFSTAMSGFSDGFVTKLNSAGTGLVWSTFLGGTQDDYPLAIEVDAGGGVYVAGYTYSFDYPLKGAFQPSSGGYADGFVTKIDPGGGRLNWSSFLGGSDYETLSGLALGSGGTVYVAGYTYSGNFPLQNPLDPTLNGTDAFVTRIDNSDPNPPGGLGQFKQNGTTVLAVGAWSNQTGIVVKATVSDSDDDSVLLRVEIKPIDAAFDGTGTVDSLAVSSGTQAAVSVPFPVGTPQYHWRCRTVDANGRLSAWVSFGGNAETARDVGQDALGPSVTIQTPTLGSSYTTAASPIALSGISSDNLSGLVSVTWTNDRGGSGSASGTASWNIGSIALSPDANVITVTATDAAGNTGSDALVVTYDTTPPTVTITSPTAAATYLTGSGTLSLGGSATDTFEVASVTWVNGAGGSGNATVSGLAPNFTWSATVPLAPGSNAITVTATDGAGNTATDLITVTYDNVAPTVSITVPTPPSATVNGAVVDVAGTSADANGIFDVRWSNSATGGSGTAFGTTSWTIDDLPLNPGANVITITARDTVLNPAIATITVYSDTLNPTVTIVSPPPPTFTTASTTVTVSGTSTDDIAVSTIQWSNALTGGSGPAALSGPVTARNWTADIPVLLGDNLITITVTDTVARTGTATITITHNTTVPSLVITSPPTATFVTPTTPYSVAGTAAADPPKLVSGITVQNTTTGAFSTVTSTPPLPVASTGFTAPVNLVIGTNTVVVTVNDNGALSTNTTLTLILDPTAPAVTITGPTGSDAYASGAATIPLSGVASDNRGITEVRWDNTTNLGFGFATLSGPSASVTWSVSSIPLDLGPNTIVVTAKDEAGNTMTDTLTATYDTTTPGVTISTPTSAPTYTTTSTPILVAGTASDNVAVQVITWSNAATGNSGAASGTTSWSISSVGLAPGANVITVIAVDSAGNTQSDSITIYRDGGPPTVAITSPTAADAYSTGAATLSLGGTSSDDVAVSSVSWQSVGATTRSGVASGTTLWSVASIPLDPGNNAITVTATDGALLTATDLLTVNYDPLAPTPVTITAPGSNPSSTTTTPLSFSGTAADNVAVTEVTWANASTGGAGTATGTTSWTTLVPLTSGTNLVAVTAKDAAGNATTVSTTVVYDPAAPIVTILTPTTGLSITTGFTPITIGGTASDDVGVVSVTWSSDRAVTPAGGTAAGTTDWSFQAPLASGDNVITVTATDGVGRTGTSFLTVIYDPTAPQVTITSPTAAPTFNTTLPTLNLGGNATDNLNLQNVVWSNAATGAGGPATGLGSWSVSSIDLVEGSNLITVTATDGVGNVGAATLLAVYDGTPPTVSISSPATDPFPTSTRPLAIAGSAGDNLDLVSVTWTNSAGGGGTAFSGSTTSVLWADSVYLFSGPNVITVTATDAHGNTSIDTITIQFTPETTGPSILIDTPSASGSAVSALQELTVGGTADDNVGIVSVTWQNTTTRVRGVAALVPAAPSLSVTWTADIPLTNGANVIVATALDDAGNAATATIVITYASPPDSVVPAVAITTPTLADTWNETVSAMSMTVTATDDVGIASVSWVNASTGGDGVATPLLGDTWSTSVALSLGLNVITVTARDPSGNTATDTLTVTFTPPPGDGANPVVTITSHPTGTTLPWTTSTIDLGGTSSDNVDVAAVIWVNAATVSSGTAEGTDAWTATILLTPGINVVTVRAYDSSGNVDTDQITILYTPPPPPPELVPGGHCGLLGLDAAAFLALLGLLRRRPRRGNPG